MLTKKEQLIEDIKKERLKGLNSVVDADGRDHGAKNDSSLISSLSKRKRALLYLREREKRRKEKALEKKKNAINETRKNTDFVKFGDVAQAPPSLPTIVF